MGDFLYGQCLKGAGRTHITIDLKLSPLDLSFKASSLKPPLPFSSHVFNLFTDIGVISSYLMVWDIFNTFRLLYYNKIKKLRGDSFSQLLRLRERWVKRDIGYFTCLGLRCGIHPADTKTFPYPHCTRTNHRGAILLNTNSVSQLSLQKIG